jgi:putative colanic acid biosynthesis acetyltransferase WcaF
VVSEAPVPLDVDLSQFDNSWYSPGKGTFLRALWFFFGSPLLCSTLNPSSRLKCWLLRIFGAKVGVGVVIKPGVRVKYPWLLTVGDHTWIGEDVWIDNLAKVELGSSVCLSQGAYLCTGNHDWSDPRFGLALGPISIESASWIGARSIVCPGVRSRRGAVLSAGSVANQQLAEYSVYQGNPAKYVRPRSVKAIAGRIE